MKIVTWNIRHGGGKRVREIINGIKKYSDSEIIILTEFRNNINGGQIKNALSNLGYQEIQTTNSEKKTNSVLIAAKSPFEVNLFNELGEHKHRIIKIKTADISVYGCYFPQKKLKSIIFDFILDQLEQGPNENIVIAGDFNTGKHKIDESGSTFYCSEYLEKLEENGLADAWRLINGPKKEYSWFSNSGNGFRIDHFYLSNPLKNRVGGCRYDHSLREDKVSDHSLMILELID